MSAWGNVCAAGLIAFGLCVLLEALGMSHDLAIAVAVTVAVTVALGGPHRSW